MLTFEKDFEVNFVVLGKKILNYASVWKVNVY